MADGVREDRKQGARWIYLIGLPSGGERTKTVVEVAQNFGG